MPTERNISRPSSARKPYLNRNQRDRATLRQQSRVDSATARRITRKQTRSENERQRWNALSPRQQKLQGPLSLDEGRRLETEMREEALRARGYQSDAKKPNIRQRNSELLDRFFKEEKERQERKNIDIRRKTDDANRKIDTLPDRSSQMADGPAKQSYLAALARRESIKNELKSKAELAMEGDFRAELSHEKWVSAIDDLQTDLSTLEKDYIDEQKKIAEDTVALADSELKKAANIKDQDFKDSFQNIQHDIYNTSADLKKLMDLPEPDFKTIDEINTLKEAIEQKRSELNQLANQQVTGANNYMQFADSELSKAFGVTVPGFANQLAPLKKAFDDAERELLKLVANPQIETINDIHRQRDIMKQVMADLDSLVNQQINDVNTVLTRATTELTDAAAITAPKFKTALAPIKQAIDTAESEIQNLVKENNIQKLDDIQQKREIIEKKLGELADLKKELGARTPGFRNPASADYRPGYKMSPANVRYDRQKQKGERNADGTTTGIIPGGKTAGLGKLSTSKLGNAKRDLSQTPQNLPPMPTGQEYIRGHQIGDSQGGANVPKNVNSHMFWQERKQTAIELEIKDQIARRGLDEKRVLFKHVAYTEPNNQGGLPVAKEIRFKIYYIPQKTDPSKVEPQLIVDELIPDNYLQNNTSPLTKAQAEKEVSDFKNALKTQLDNYFDIPNDDNKNPIYWEGKKLTPLGKTPIAYRDAAGLKGDYFDTATKTYIGPMVDNPTKTPTP